MYPAADDVLYSIMAQPYTCSIHKYDIQHVIHRIEAMASDT